MPDPMDLAAFQLAALSIVTSSTSELLSVFRMPHMYWSTSRPSSCAGLLHRNEIISHKNKRFWPRFDLLANRTPP